MAAADFQNRRRVVGTHRGAVQEPTIGSEQQRPVQGNVRRVQADGACKTGHGAGRARAHQDDMDSVPGEAGQRGAGPFGNLVPAVQERAVEIQGDETVSR